MSDLPITPILPSLAKALAGHANVILAAEPGAGKTTRVPLALLERAWLKGRKIVMLEPRRLAARAAASRMAQSLDEAVGETVGYAVRLDRKVSAATRIEVVTEGILTRQSAGRSGAHSMSAFSFSMSSMSAASMAIWASLWRSMRKRACAKTSRSS